ncbi:MAG: PAS domain S-box protein, partial [Arcobacteraceae bacterium]
MKISFYLKIFLAFVLFSLILFIVFTLMFKSVYEKDFRKKETDAISQSFQNKQNLFDAYARNIKTQLNALSQNEVFERYIKNKENENEVIELFRFLLISNEDIAQIKFLSLSGNEIIRLNHTQRDIEIVPKIELQNRIIQDYCKNVRALKVGEAWHSDFEVNKEKGEISRPLYFIMRFVLKTPNGFLSIIVNADYILEQIHNIYYKNSFILDQKGNYIVHENSQYNWSKYTTGNQSIHKLYGNDAENILEYNELNNQEFMSKRLYINPQEYIILLTQFDKNRYKEYFEVFKEYFLVLIIVGFVIAVILALLFTQPINKLNQKTEEDNKYLDLTIKKNIEELSESLNIIDKHVMSVHMDKEGIILEGSTAFCDFTGFSKAELLGHHHKMLMHPDMAEKEYKELWQKMQEGKPIFSELKGIKKDGGFYWIASNIEPILDEKQNILGFNAIRNNITDKKLIENLYSDINYQVQQYNAIFQNAHSGIGLIDLKGNFKRVNVVFSELLGYSSIEILHLNCLDIVHKNSKIFLEKIFVEAKEIGSISNIEKIFMHKEGSSIHLEMSLNLLPDKNHFVIVMNSLQDKRKLQELNQNLELKIKEEVEKSRKKDKIHQHEQLENIK